MMKKKMMTNKTVHVVTRNEELTQENQFLIDLLVEVAEGTHKSKRLYDWYIDYCSDGKFDNG